MTFKGPINCSILFHCDEELSYLTFENIYSLRVCDVAHALSHLNLTILLEVETINHMNKGGNCSSEEVR